MANTWGLIEDRSDFADPPLKNTKKPEQPGFATAAQPLAFSSDLLVDLGPRTSPRRFIEINEEYIKYAV